MAKYRVHKRFLEQSGQWHHPGDVVELSSDRAQLFLSRGWISEYRTEMVTPPETRGKRRRDAQP
jgi:hypothetical protein